MCYKKLSMEFFNFLPETEFKAQRFIESLVLFY